MLRDSILRVFMIAAVAAVGLAAGAYAASEPASDASTSSAEKRPAARGKRKDPLPAFTPEREAAAMAFVRQHHPEVAELLERLKANHPAQYRRAAAQLFRASERLAQWKNRDPQRYELELRTWKIQSRIHLLLARSTMAQGSNANAADDELREALAEQADVRLAVRKHERDQLARRLAAAEADIERMTKNRETAIERQLTSLRQGIDKSRRALKAKSAKRAPREHKAAKDVVTPENAPRKNGAANAASKDR